MSDARISSARIPVEDSIEAVNNIFYSKGWTDGLPVIPPTEDRVRQMLSGTRRDPAEIVALIAPRNAPASMEKIAINAVMAGCLPEYMPVLIAAVEAMTDKGFNLMGVQNTTHPCAPLIIVNGPIAGKLGLNCAGNAFGQGNRANATIGRAIRLLLLNVGGGIPGVTDKSTQGGPAKYTYCIAENEKENPWGPLHVERGFKAEESTVTVFAAEAPHNINDHASTSGKGIMTTAASMVNAGNNNITYFLGDVLFAFGPEHARTIAKDGFSREDIKSFLFENARIPIARFSQENIEFRKRSPHIYGPIDDKIMVPVCARKDDIVVLVVGGAGKHSCFIPTFALSFSVTRAIVE